MTMVRHVPEVILPEASRSKERLHEVLRFFAEQKNGAWGLKRLVFFLEICWDLLLFCCGFVVFLLWFGWVFLVFCWVLLCFGA